MPRPNGYSLPNRQKPWHGVHITGRKTSEDLNVTSFVINPQKMKENNGEIDKPFKWKILLQIGIILLPMFLLDIHWLLGCKKLEPTGPCFYTLWNVINKHHKLNNNLTLIVFCLLINSFFCILLFLCFPLKKKNIYIHDIHKTKNLDTRKISTKEKKHSRYM